MVRESLNLGIGVLLAVTVAVLAGVAGFIASLARRARDAGPLADEPGA